MKKSMTKSLLMFAVAATLSVSAVSLPNNVSAATQNNQNITFEEFADDPDDPQAYTEYEKLMTNTVASRRSSSNKLNITALSGANTPFKSGDYAHDARFADCEVIHGIDVSSYQNKAVINAGINSTGAIDWASAKAGGVSYAIIRVAYRGYGSGAIVDDDYYKMNIEGALAAGIDVGVYIYSQAITEDEAREEAAHTISLVQGYDISLPIVMDFEYASNASGTTGRLYKAKLSKAQATSVCNAFCNQVEAQGYTAMFYANKSMLGSAVYADQISANYPVWLAVYPAKAASGAGYTGEYSYWQYTSTGEVAGIPGNVDCNFRYMKNPAAPVSIQNPDVSYTDNTISWSKVPGVYGYELYRAKSATGEYTKIATLKGASTISYFDYDLTPGTPYQYKVRAFYKLSSGNRYGAFSQTEAAPTPDLSVSSFQAVSQTDSSVTLTWGANVNATGYAIYQSTDGSNYTLVANVPAGTTSYEVSNLASGTKYYFQIRAGITGSDGSMIYEKKSVAPVVLTSTKTAALAAVTVKSTKNTIKLSWKKVTGASGYQVYQYSDDEDEYVHIATLSGASKKSYTVRRLKNAKAYKFKVRSYKTVDNKKVYSQFTSIVYAATSPTNVTKLWYRSKKNSVTLSWAKVKGASGYIIYRYDSASGKYKKIKTVKTNKYTNKKLKANKKYIYKVKAYKTYKKKSYNSEAVKITTRTKK